MKSVSRIPSNQPTAGSTCPYLIYIITRLTRCGMVAYGPLKPWDQLCYLTQTSDPTDMPSSPVEALYSIMRGYKVSIG